MVQGHHFFGGECKMKGIILQEIKSNYFTNMKDIFDAMNNSQSDYNWLITDYECNHYPTNNISCNQEYIWISGKELSDIVSIHGIQFIWGVFSAFTKDVPLAEVMKHTYPFADGNTGLWNPIIKTQHPLADIEIVSWDSSLVLVISKCESIVTDINNFYPDAIDIEKYID